MRKQQKTYPQKRDWAIIALFVAIVATNWYWYRAYQTQTASQKSATNSWLQQQVQINKLNACIDNATRPCDASYSQ